LENKIFYIVKSLFRKYYSDIELNEEFIKDFNKREIALWEFGSDTLKRHLSFKDFKQLKEFLSKNTPLHLYISTATYEFPSIPSMEDKRLISASLVFDIDIDHINTPCKFEHDFWKCRKCNNFGKGFILKCEECGRENIERKSFVCNKCLDYAKLELFKLIEDFLFKDFGLSKDEIKIIFSGNRGYHVYVLNEEYSKFSSKERSLIVDYIKGTSLKIYFFENLKNNNYKYLGMNSLGIFSRICENIYNKISRMNLEDLKSYGIKEQKAEKIIKNKERILKNLNRYIADYSFLKYFGKFSLNFINEIISNTCVEIDERVTVDVHRLIRFPNSLHGKTGLKVKPLKYEELENFDPFKDSLVFKKGYAKVLIDKEIGLNKLIMNGQEFDLKNLPKEIPIYLALYLYLNDYGKITEIYL